MKRENIKKVVLVAIDKGIIEKGDIDILERAEEVTTIIAEELLDSMKGGIKAELEAYADELQTDLEHFKVNEDDAGGCIAGFMATFTNIMDLLEE